MKKKNIVIIVFIFIICLFGYRYYKVNHNIPLEYTFEYYGVGDYADCEGLKIKVISKEIKESDAQNKVGTEFIELELKSEILNTTDKVIDGVHFQESPVVIDNYYAYSGPIKLENGDLKNIQPGEKLETTQVYILEKKKYEEGKDKLCIYLGEALYPNQVRQKFGEGIRYRKVLSI